MNPAVLIGPIVLLVLIGLRDKTIFLAARGEQYLPALVFFAALPFVDMIIALQAADLHRLVLGRRLQVRAALHPRHSAHGQQQPVDAVEVVKRAHYRDYPDNLRPSHLATFMAHGRGTIVEIIAPLMLLLSPWPWLTVIAVAIMVSFHLFIISTFPLAVPLEWNALFAYAVMFLFWGFPNWQGYAIWDMSSPWLAVVILAGLCFFPVLGNLRPDLVSFLPAMRQYAGNWASATVGVRAGRRSRS